MVWGFRPLTDGHKGRVVLLAETESGLGFGELFLRVGLYFVDILRGSGVLDGAVFGVRVGQHSSNAVII